MKRRRLKKEVINFLILLFLLLFIYSSYKIIMWQINVSKNKNIKENIINKSIRVIKDEEKKEKYIVDFDALSKINSDTVAYIKVSGTDINYIVVKANDNEYYLKHNFNNEYNIAGWIFADYRNKFDDSDKNIIIYGHNTKDGSMFGSLKNVLESSWQENKENLKITLITNKKIYTYEVFSTYSIIPEDYYISTDFVSDDEYLDFLNILMSRSNFNYDVSVNSNDKILTLSSCLLEGQKRVVLHAKMIAEDEN